VMVADWERNGTSGGRDDRDGLTPIYQRSRPHTTTAQSADRLDKITGRLTSRLWYANRLDVPRTAHGGRVRQARNTVGTPSSLPVFSQVRRQLMRSPPRPGDAWIRPTHSPRDTADGLRNRSLSREKPVTPSSVTGFELRKCVAGVGFEPT